MIFEESTVAAAHRSAMAWPDVWELARSLETSMSYYFSKILEMPFARRPST